MRKYLRRLHIFKPIILPLVGLVFFGYIFWRFLFPLFIFAQENSLTPSFFFRFIFAQKLPLTSLEERTNLLILGMAGGNHAGGDLTDTMLFLSFNQEKKKTANIFLPRDIWSETLKDKVNSAYHYGEEKKKGGGLILSASTVEEVLGQPVHYTFLVDFSGFEEIINLLGGVNLYVARSFNDYKFPLSGKEEDLCNGDPEFNCRFEHVRFEKGWQKMDGATALKFIRSRNAIGEEGTDFARGRRQQQVLEALKKEIFSFQTLTKPNLLLALLNILAQKSESNTNLGETLYLAKLFFNIKDKKTISLDEELINPPVWQYGGRWVLVPKEGWENFHQFIKLELNKG